MSSDRRSFKNDFFDFEINGEDHFMAWAVFNRRGNEDAKLRIIGASKEFENKFKALNHQSVIAKWIVDNKAKTLFLQNNQFQLGSLADAVGAKWEYEILSFNKKQNRFDLGDDGYYVISSNGHLKWEKEDDVFPNRPPILFTSNPPLFFDAKGFKQALANLPESK